MTQNIEKKTTHKTMSESSEWNEGFVDVLNLTRH